MSAVFWFSFFLILYVYIGYPVLIWVLSQFYKKRVKIKYLYPTVSIVLSAYNEEKFIDAKIKSLLAQEYPENRFDIIIGSDGSTDRTNEIVSQYAGVRLKFIKQDERQGKPSMLNSLVKHSTGEILVLTDARQRLDPNALEELVRNFGDKKVGSASGILFYEADDAGSRAESGVGLYWKYEKFIRKSESRMGSMLGATGALYAIRRELFPELPVDLILDDVYIPMKIVEQGYRAVFDSKAKVFDRVFPDPKQEFARKTRTLAGNFQLFVYLKELFNPLKGKISWQFFSHKFLRLMVPYFLIMLFVSNLFLLQQGILYLVIAELQVVFYAGAAASEITKQKNKVFDVAHMFCVMNIAAVVGLYKFLANKQRVTWRKV